MPRSQQLWPAWVLVTLLPALRVAWLPAVLAAGAEAGHLLAAVWEWPGSGSRGAFHVAAGGLLGLIAVSVYFGPTRLERAIGCALAVLLPVTWLAGAGLGASPYHESPLPIALAVATLELAVAGLLALGLSRRVG